MNHFSFYSPTEFVFGRGTEQQAGALCRAYGATRVLVVYGQGHVVRSGLLRQLTDQLLQAGLACVTLGGVQPNPLDDKVYEGISLARREHVDFLLAVGGGSVIDTAKAIAAGVCYDGDFWDFYGLNVPVERALKVGVVLTIPAAGSEGSGNSVITRREGLVKVSLRTPKILRPVFAVMNPELTFTLPPFQTACGIADMMAHIMERYFTNTPHCETTDRLCEGLLCAIIEQGRRVMDCPDDYDARANLMWSGTLAHNGVCGVGREEDWYSHFLEHKSVPSTTWPTVPAWPWCSPPGSPGWPTIIRKRWCSLPAACGMSGRRPTTRSRPSRGWLACAATGRASGCPSRWRSWALSVPTWTRLPTSSTASRGRRWAVTCA